MCGSSTNSTAGGYNGGGSTTYVNNASDYGGGGATDIRVVRGVWNDTLSLQSRIMVAGGGGGSYYYAPVSDYCFSGADAGGLQGYNRRYI